VRSYGDEPDQSDPGQSANGDMRGTRGCPNSTDEAGVKAPKVSLQPVTTAPPEVANRLLAMVRYGIGGEQPLLADAPLVSVPLRQLNRPELSEVWSSVTPVVVRHYGRFHCASNDDVLFGSCRLDESATVTPEALACQLYTELARLIRDEGYPHLVRVWNYLYAINDEQEGLERYRHFCVGRHAALSALGDNLEYGLPAASAIGTRERGLNVYFLAAREPGEPIENPRQTSAYHYPAQYSPRSPLFARAMLKEWGSTRYLFISGTASIVRHETVHRGDLRAQLSEVFSNIDALLDQAGRVTRTDFRKSTQALLKVYVRRANDFLVIQDEVRRRVGTGTPVVYLEADLCRRELLVEIEGVYCHGG
jgi:chorismate lyase/3-hydroxybenzoate synthase